MKITTLVVAASLLLVSAGSWAQSENLNKDICRIRGNIASQIVGQHSRGASLDTIKNSFAGWVSQGMPGTTELNNAQMNGWFDSWTKPVYAKWFEGVFAKYNDYEVAFSTEVAACLADDNAPPN